MPSAGRMSPGRSRKISPAFTSAAGMSVGVRPRSTQAEAGIRASSDSAGAAARRRRTAAAHCAALPQQRMQPAWKKSREEYQSAAGAVSVPEITQEISWMRAKRLYPRQSAALRQKSASCTAVPGRSLRRAPAARRNTGRFTAQTGTVRISWTTAAPSRPCAEKPAACAPYAAAPIRSVQIRETMVRFFKRIGSSKISIGSSEKRKKMKMGGNKKGTVRGSDSPPDCHSLPLLRFAQPLLQGVPCLNSPQTFKMHKSVYPTSGTVPQKGGTEFNRKFENSSQSLSGRRLWGEFSKFSSLFVGSRGRKPLGRGFAASEQRDFSEYSFGHKRVPPAAAIAIKDKR